MTARKPCAWCANGRSDCECRMLAYLPTRADIETATAKLREEHLAQKRAMLSPHYESREHCLPVLSTSIRRRESTVGRI